MNEGQERFAGFILERVQAEYTELAKELLQEGFDKQAKNAFNGEYVQEYMAKMQSYLKPQYLEEVMQIMQNFKPE